VNWQALFETFRAIGYDGYVTSEVIVSEQGMPDAEQAEHVCREMAQLIEQYH